MSTQPEALRLADALMEEYPFPRDVRFAAAKLRRLAAIEAQRDALLEALKSTGLFLHYCWCDVQMNDYSFERLNRQMAIVDFAIKAAEEGK